MTAMLARTQAIDPDGLETQGLSVAYRGVEALSDLTVTLPRAGLVAVIGPNGAGKSSFLKALLGLTPATGTARFAGLPMEAARARTAYVPQRASVDWDFPASARDVVLQGMVREVGWFRPYGGARRATADRLLDQVGLADLADRQIGAMSGGQQQRVFLARGLARKADLLLLDEPLAGVDAASEAIIFAVLAREAAAGRLILCVHHDLSSVAAHFDHVVILNRRLIAAGPTREVFTPAALASAYGAPVAA